MDGQLPAEPVKAAPGSPGPFTSPGSSRSTASWRRWQVSGWVWAAQLCLVILLVSGMQALNASGGNLIMPSPLAVARQSVSMWSDGTMLLGLGQSLLVLGLGFALAAFTGIAGGILLGGFPVVGRILDPFVNAMNATPGAAFIPLVIVWFGLYAEAKVVVVWNAAMFPILIATAAGISNANAELTEMAQSFGAGRRQLFWQVMVPDSLPAILSGLRIGAAVSIVGTVIAELTTAQSGLGGLMIAAGNRFQMDRYFAVVIVMMVLGTAITAGLRRVERRFGRWRQR
jgi:NitT/TauT family transport system permease protein